MSNQITSETEVRECRRVYNKSSSSSTQGNSTIK